MIWHAKTFSRSYYYMGEGAREADLAPVAKVYLFSGFSLRNSTILPPTLMPITEYFLFKTFRLLN